MDELIMKWEHLTKTLNDYGEEVRNLYQDNLIKSDSIATGDLLNSVEYRVVSDNVGISVELQLADYWKYIEYGTKPHWPPVSKILEWVKVKPILPEPDGNGKLPTPEQLAYLIGRKISLDGTQAKGDLQSAVAYVNEKYLMLIEDAIEQDIDAASSAILTQFFTNG